MRSAWLGLKCWIINEIKYIIKLKNKKYKNWKKLGTDNALNEYKQYRNAKNVFLETVLKTVRILKINGKL